MPNVRKVGSATKGKTIASVATHKKVPKGITPHEPAKKASKRGGYINANTKEFQKTMEFKDRMKASGVSSFKEPRIVKEQAKNNVIKRGSQGATKKVKSTKKGM